uniref:DUF663 domain-containing protein n=1 Tax=Bursaphelenchus xylophilus TaxID=6326 RepID=A0A1I7S8F4_BURXY
MKIIRFQLKTIQFQPEPKFERDLLADVPPNAKYYKGKPAHCALHNVTRKYLIKTFPGHVDIMTLIRNPRILSVCSWNQPFWSLSVVLGKKREDEVIYGFTCVDEYVVQQLKEFDVKEMHVKTILSEN